MPATSSYTDSSRIDYDKLKNVLEKPSTKDQLFETIVNLPFTEYKLEMAFLFLGIISLLQVDKFTGDINRVALSKTELADDIAKVSVKPFKSIKINLKHKDNFIVQAIETDEVREVTDWKDMLTPALTKEEAHINQAGGGIACSIIYPLRSFTKGALVFHFYQYQRGIDEAQRHFMDKYTELVDARLAQTA